MQHSGEKFNRWLIALIFLALTVLLTPSARGQAPNDAVAVPAWRQATRLAVITVQGEIDAVTRTSVERRIAEASTNGFDAVVLEIDTPGGDMYATLELCLFLKDRAPLPVWAWVHPKAYSAGAIIALACRGIIVSPGAAFGDAAPIAVLPGMGLQPLPTAERAKMEAPVLAEVVDSARRRGYDENLVRAYVSAPDEVWLLERVTPEASGGARIFVGRPEYREAFGTDPPTMRAAGTQRVTFEEGAPAIPFVDLSLRKRNDDGPRNAIERDVMVEDQQTRPPVRERLTAATANEWRVVGQVDGAEELLVTYAPEAIAFGLADREVGTDQELTTYFGATSMQRLDEHAGDALVRFLTSWPVRLILVVVLLGGFLIEIAAPGIGLFGAAAALALALLVGAPALAGITSWWPLLVVLLGAALVLVEIFLIPGVGIIGFLGGACMLVGLVAGFLDAPLSSPEGRDDLTTAIGVVAGGGILAIGTAWALLRAVPESRLLRRAILGTTTGSVRESMLASNTGAVPVGAHGTALSPLRPVGKAEFAGVLMDVQAIGPVIDTGARIVVVRSTPYALDVEQINE
jgi:membrane-bound serine protease (ClpP class)